MVHDTHHEEGHMSEQPTLSTSGTRGFFSPRRVARVAILVALSGVGAFIKIPSPTGTVASTPPPDTWPRPLSPRWRVAWWGRSGT